MLPGKGKYRNVLTVVFIAIMLFNYANATLFWHCHRIGSMEVVHSHIHGSAHTAGNDSGGHTTGQLQIIDVICHALYTADAVPEIHLERQDVLYGVLQVPDCLQEDACRQIEAEVRMAWTSYQAALETAEACSDAMLRDAAGILESRREAYRQGDSSLLDYLMAVRVYNDTAEACIGARSALFTAWSELINAVGTEI